MTVERVLWGGVLVILMSIPLTSNEYYYYFCFFILVVLGMAGKVVYSREWYGKSGNIKKSNKISVIPMMMIIIWIFGILVGLIQGNPFQNIVRNFAGSVCYLLYYVLAFRKPVKKEIIISALWRASIIATIFTALAFICKQRGIIVWPLNNVTYNQYSNNLTTSVEILSFILEAVCIWKIFGRKILWRKKIKYVLLFVLSSYVLLFTNSMGGFKLGYIAILGMILFFALFYNPGYSKKQKIFGLLFFAIMSVLAVVCDLNGKNIIGEIFSLRDVGNTKRFLQIQLVEERFKIFGNGLGSVMEYNFNGKVYLGYGVEVSYLNVIDKYGIFSIFVLFVFANTLILAFKGLKMRNINQEVYVMAIGACGYLFVAIGNPVLFSAYNVMLHSIVLYLLTYGEIGVKLHE